MNHESEDESSDSSDEFLVSPDKINLDSSFFTEATRKPNLETAQTANDDPEESDDSDDFDDDNHVSSAELLSQVLKNLENANKSQSVDDVKPDSRVGAADRKDNKKAALVEVRDSDLSNEISDLLLLGEGEAKASTSYQDDDVDDNAENEEEAPAEYSIPKEGVKITLPNASAMLFNRKKKGGQDLETLLRNRMNQHLRTTQASIHKVGLLCWLSYGFHLNRQANDPEVLATALSLISSNSYPKGRLDLKYLERITKWFRSLFRIDSKKIDELLTKELLLERLRSRAIRDYRELVLLYTAVLRAIGVNCRLVVSLCPPALKISRDKLFQSNASKEKEKSVADSKPKKIVEKGKGKTTGNRKGKKSGVSAQKASPEKIVPENSQESQKGKSLDAKKRAAAILKATSSDAKPRKKGSGTLVNEGREESNAEESRAGPKKRGRSKDDSSRVEKEEQESSLVTTRSLRSKSNVLIKSRTDDKGNLRDSGKESSKSEQTLSQKSKRLKPSASTDESSVKKEENDSEDEFQATRPVKRKLNTTNLKSVQKTEVKDGKNRKLISSDEDDGQEENSKETRDVWAEVYVESEESWICVNISDEKIHCVAEIYKKATSPVLYVIAWNSSGTLKDVTRRYCPQWLTVTRKQRVDEKWWAASLEPWKEEETALSKEEDEMLLQRELEQPLPKTVGECKGHPLYALARHLLKFEAIYPEDAVPLGHLKTGEAIYSRHCVHTLRSRETWLKQARVVKPAQEPYKIVKSMPKYDKFSGTMVKDRPLEIFGKWQTMPYVPPEAKNGIVPRNEYGNVDLFKQCMLPKGTVHIERLNRIARKLNIDCAPAVLGFNFGGMGAVPAFGGFIVCSEFEDVLREAWETEQVEAAKRARERVEKRVYGNWRKLIKGLFIRQRLAARYEFNDDEKDKPAPSNKRPKQRKGGQKKSKL